VNFCSGEEYAYGDNTHNQDDGARRPCPVDKFRALRKQVVSDGIGDLAKVFVPVGAAPPARLNRMAPRVLFVGRATNGWNEEKLDSFDGSRKQAEDILKEWVARPNRSALWQFSRAVLRQALRSCNIEADDVELSRLLLYRCTGNWRSGKSHTIEAWRFNTYTSAMYLRMGGC